MRQHISVELKKVALRLAVVKGYKYKEIRKITGISEQSTEHLCALYQHTGDVVRRRTVDGRPRVLNGFELSV
jgi:transposase